MYVCVCVSFSIQTACVGQVSSVIAEGRGGGEEGEGGGSVIAGVKCDCRGAQRKPSER